MELFLNLIASFVGLAICKNIKLKAYLEATKISENASNAVKEFTWDKLYSEKMLDLFKNQ